MKRILFLTCIFLTTFCSLNADEYSYGGVIRFNKIIHDFGDILISEGPKKCTFQYTNISDKPIFIHDIITSCGCTDPKWEKKPVMPGKSGTISVEFLNDQGPFPFDKSLTVMVSDVGKPVILRIRGVAHEKKKSLEELFGYKYGEVGFRTDYFTVGQIDQGLLKSEETEIANLSRKSIKITFEDTTPGLIVKVSPNPIPPGDRARVTFTVDTQKNSKELWGQNNYITKIVVNGKKDPKEIQVSAFIKENFSAMTPEQKKAAALPTMKSSSKEFQKVNRGTILKGDFLIKNQGKTTLLIYKMEGNLEGYTFKFPESIEPGKEAMIEYAYDTTKAPSDFLGIISMITNSPTRPVVNYFITVLVE